MSTAVRMRTRRATSCACGCGSPLSVRGARNLAGRCYDRLHRTGALVDYPPVQRPLVEVVEDWPYVTHDGIDQAAAALGMTRPALDQALRRAVAAGLLTREEARPWWDFARGCRRS